MGRRGETQDEFDERKIFEDAMEAMRQETEADLAEIQKGVEDARKEN
jgi:hypothetical protein